MKTNTEKQAEYIALKRNLIEKKVVEVAQIVTSNAMNHANNQNKYFIELTIGSAMAGAGINVYLKDDRIESADCYGIYWPFENMMFFNKDRFDRDVKIKLKEIKLLHDIAKKYFDLNNK